jgi:hypothetical protein
MVRAIIVLMMKTVCTSETSVYFCESTPRHVPKGYHFSRVIQEENTNNLHSVSYFLYFP